MTVDWLKKVQVCKIGLQQSTELTANFVPKQFFLE